MAESLIESLQRLEWPTYLRDAPEPAPGQIWRVRGSGVACLAVIYGTTTSPPSVSVWAASADRVGDGSAIDADCENGAAITVWPSIKETIPVVALDYRLTDLTPEAFLLALRGAEGLRTGYYAPIVSILDDRLMIKLNLIERLARIGECW